MKRNRIFYALLFLLSFIFVYFYGGRMPYMLFYAVLLLPVVSLVYTSVIYYRFKYTQEIDSKFIMKGEKVHFIFSVHNEDLLLYPYIRVTFMGSETIFRSQFQSRCFSIMPLSKKSFAFELECKYRGFYSVGIKSVEIEDFLGIFRLTYNIFEPRYITVYPRIIQLERIHMNTYFLSEAHSVLSSIYQDNTTLSDIRRYSEGDSIRKIHWKLTAKQNELMIKNFQSTSQNSAIIFMDLRTNPYEIDLNTIIEDKLIEALVAVSNYALSNWININLVYFNGEIADIEGKTPLDFNEIYKILSTVRFDQNVNISDVMDIYLDSNVTKTNITIFTSNLDYNLFNGIYKAQYQGYDLTLVYISPEELTNNEDTEVENIISFLPELGVLTYKINISDDIKRIFEL